MPWWKGRLLCGGHNQVVDSGSNRRVVAGASEPRADEKRISSEFGLDPADPELKQHSL